MPDGLTAHTPPPTHEPLVSEPEDAPRSPWVVAALQALVIVVVFGVVGVGFGWLWYHVWDAPSGVVASHQWYTNEAGLRADFGGVAWYVTIALVAGLEWTRFGARVRAAVDNQRMARGLGIDVDGAFAVTFALGSGLAGLGGAAAAAAERATTTVSSAATAASGTVAIESLQKCTPLDL